MVFVEGGKLKGNPLSQFLFCRTNHAKGSVKVFMAM